MWPCHSWLGMDLCATTNEPDQENDMTMEKKIARRKFSLLELANRAQEE